SAGQSSALGWTCASLTEFAGDAPVGLGPPGVVEEDRVDDGLRPVQLYAEPLHGLTGLEADVRPEELLDPGTEEPILYATRFFMSQRGYTDWHVHYDDETLLVQLVGTKELLLLSPDNRTFCSMLPLSMRRPGSGRHTRGVERLVPHRVVLEPGDALSIPMHWWHCAEALEDGLNISLAHTFGTPQRWRAEPRLLNTWFSIVIAVINVGAQSVAARRPRGVRPFVRSTAAVVRGAPSALRRNGSGPGRRRYWNPDAPVAGRGP
ncbi:MAG: cupin-like domain-containing protein, partial [Myxococcota bacterium]